MDERYEELEREVSEKAQKLDEAWAKRNSKVERERWLWRAALDDLHEAGQRFATYREELEKSAH
jgi:hypothetical protein